MQKVSTGRRFRLTPAVVCTTCFTLALVVLVVRVGRAAPHTDAREQRLNRLHQRNKFFNPLAARDASTPSLGTPVASFPTGDQVVSLKDVPVAEPMAAVIPVVTPGVNPIPGPDTPLNFQPLTADIVKDQTELIALGKALFWDMQVGSDGVQACATCHFNGGADIRTTNQINPGQNSEDFHSTPNPAPAPCPANPINSLTGDSFFGNSTVPFTANDPLTPNPPGPSDPPPANLNVPGLPSFGPNATVVGGNFPLNDWGHPTKLVPRGIGSIKVSLQQEFADATQDTNDSVTSQGVRLTQFLNVVPGSAVDNGTPLCDIANTATPGLPNLNGVVRRTEPRNAPTMINAVFNFDNLWDGKASFVFNGVDAFGFRNRTGTLKRANSTGGLDDVFLRVTNSSLASVAADVPTSRITMSFQGRTIADVGKKMVSLSPLAYQKVHPQDSVLGRLARGERTGLNVGTYADMIKAAFQDQWWNSSTPVVVGTKSYAQIEFNFSMFMGLSVQAYMSTLISDDTPFDRFEGALHPVRDSKGNACPPGGCSPIAPDANALSPQQQAGYALFNDVVPDIGTHCADCHVPPIMSSHTILDNQPNSQGVPSLAQGEAIEFMKMGDDLAEANYDHGFYNITVRRTTDDKGRIATGGSTNPLRPTVSIASISRSAGIVTVKTDPHTTFPGLGKKDNVTIAGVADTSFNGTVAVTSVKVSQVDLSSTFTYAQATLADGSSTGGTVTAPAKAFPFSLVELVGLLDSHACDAATVPHVGCLPPDVARFLPKIPILQRRVTHGAFKVPILRNLKFTGPYFHVGDSATLRQVVEFYARGGNFPNTNLHDKTVDIDGIPALDVTTDPAGEERIRALVDFLAEGLKDPRVAFERAPFDHPEICVPNGARTGSGESDGKEEKEFEGCGGQVDTSKDAFLDIPAVGSHGRHKELPTFLNLDPQQSDTSVAGFGSGAGGGVAGVVGGTAQTGYPGALPTGAALTTQAAIVNPALIKGKDLNGAIPAGFAEAGYFEAATLDSASPNSGGTVTINGNKMIVPANSIIQFPANTLTWAQFFNTVGNTISAPVYDPGLHSTQVNLTIKPGTTGLAIMDNPTRIQTQSPFIPFNAVVIGNIDVLGTTINNVTGAHNPPGTYIVGLILPMGQDLGNAGQGFITCIDYGKGRFEVGGTVSTLTGGACGATPTGQVVEINDPSGRYGWAHSPDPRWSVDPDNPTIAASNGYPMGIPKVAPPAIDPDRPITNRPLNPPIPNVNHDPFLPVGVPMEVFAMPPSGKAGTTTPDPWKQAPFMVGDYVIYSGILAKNNPTVAFNPALPTNQQTYISANTVSATQLMIYTAPGAGPGDTSVGPAYMQLARGVIGTGPKPAAAPPAAIVPPNATFGVVGGTIPIGDPKLNMVLVGFVTDPTQLVDIFAADIDPTTGAETDRLLGFALPDPGIPGPTPGSLPRGPVGRFVFTVDRSDLQPTTRVYLAQSEHGQVQVPNQTGTIVPLEGGLMSGQYHAPMFGFIYPDPVPGFPIIPNNFNSQDFLRLGEGGNPTTAPTQAQGPLTPFPPCLAFTGDPTCP
jgi:cytochrome c peroxidase